MAQFTPESLAHFAPEWWLSMARIIQLHDEIECYIRTTRIGNSSFDVMHVLVKITPNDEEICTTGKTVCVSYDYKENKSIPIPPVERQKMIAFDEPGLILNTN